MDTVKRYKKEPCTFRSFESRVEKLSAIPQDAVLRVIDLFDAALFAILLGVMVARCRRLVSDTVIAYAGWIYFGLAP